MNIIQQIIHHQELLSDLTGWVPSSSWFVLVWVIDIRYSVRLTYETEHQAIIKLNPSSVKDFTNHHYPQVTSWFEGSQSLAFKDFQRRVSMEFPNQCWPVGYISWAGLHNIVTQNRSIFMIILWLLVYGAELMCYNNYLSNPNRILLKIDFGTFGSENASSVRTFWFIENHAYKFWGWGKAPPITVSVIG